MPLRPRRVRKAMEPLKVGGRKTVMLPWRVETSRSTQRPACISVYVESAIN